jgi:hypothetical protein
VTDRRTALGRISIGDIFNAEGETGSTRICVAMSISEAAILARDISTQALYEFDRQTGVAVRYFSSTPYRYTINSVAPLPDDIREIFLRLDEKLQEAKCRRAEDPGWEQPREEGILTKEEIRAYLFIDDFYRSNPI